MAHPQMVSRITNDKVFYGKEFKSFVNSPLGEGVGVKEKLRVEYASRFAEWIKFYEEFQDV